MDYKIKELREKKKMSQAELARLSGVSRATIIRLENSEDVVINTRTLENLANALNVSIRSLFLTEKFNEDNKSNMNLTSS